MTKALEDELDFSIIEFYSQIAPIEKLENFPMDPQDPIKSLKEGKNLPIQWMILLDQTNTNPVAWIS